MALVFNDTFTVGANTALSGHSSDSGGSWADHPSYSGCFIFNSYQAVSSSSSSTTAVLTYVSSPVLTSPDYSISFDLVVASTNSAASSQGVTLRFDNVANDGYTIRAFPNINQFQLYRFDSGSATLLDTITYTLGVGTYSCIAGVTTNGSGDVELTLSVGGVAQTWNTAASTAHTDSSVNKKTAIGYPGIRTSAQSNRIDNFQVDGTVAAGDTITLDEKENGQVIQRNSATSDAAVTISGTYSGTPTAIECRILQAADDTTEVVTWATLDAAPSGGTFSGTATVPEGGWYHAEVRYSNDTGVTDLHAQDWGVGILVACWGQSNIENWFTDGTGTPSGEIGRYFSGNWGKQLTTGSGAIAFANAIAAEFSVPVGLIDSGIGGSQLGGGLEWGSDAPSSTYDNAKTAIVNNGSACEAVLWMQGEADIIAGTTKANYITDLENLITTRLRGFATNASTAANLPFFIGQIGRRTGTADDAAHNEIRSALKAVADGAVADVYYAAEMYDLPLADTVHLTGPGYATHGQRFAQAVIDILGSGTYHRGPQITSASQVDTTTIDVNISHGGGSDFTPTSAITGFEVFDDAAPLTISAAVRQSATVIRLTVTPAIAGTPTARYMYGANPIITGVVLDNSGLSLPLEMAGDTFAVLSNVDALLANDLQSLSQLSIPTATSTPGVDSLLADDIQSLSTVTMPVIGQVHVMAADSIESATQLSRPVVNRPDTPNAILVLDTPVKIKDIQVRVPVYDADVQLNTVIG